MLKKIKYVFQNVMILINILKEEKKSPFKTSIKQKILGLGNGFQSEKVLMYGMNKKNIKSFISEHDRHRAKRINEKAFHVFDNKLITERVLSRFVTVPECYYIINNGKVVSSASGHQDSISYEELIVFIKQKGKLVLKPISGGSGTGVQVVTYERETDTYHTNKESHTSLGMFEFLKRLNNYLVQDFVYQGSYSSALFPESTNTIRVLTMIDPDTNEPFIAAAAQRIGNHKTKPIDNFGGGRGGISVRVDTETGQLASAVKIDTTGRKQAITHHPDTQAELVGRTVPNWDKIKSDLLMTISKNPYLKYVGWDIVVTDAGFTVIEINSFSGVSVFQVHQPLTHYDKRIKGFYRHHKVL